MLNKVIIMGRCGRDPEKRMTPSGVPVTNVTLAVDRDFGKDGQKETNWIDIVAFKETANFLANYFSKGKMAIVAGRLQIRRWEDKNGNKRSTAEVVAENVYFGESKNDVGSRYESAMKSRDVEPDYPAIYGDDAELPF
jgi:single-strand DNA-binding protein